MLSHLTLKDFAVVSAVELAFDRGLTVVSGETGAGKSLLVDALLALTGTRADAGMVRHGAERAELCAEFRLGDTPLAQAWLRDNELDEQDECQLRRVIRADGGSRAWINGRPATLAQLAELGSLLLEVHGQHEHQALLERGHQLDLLDAFGQHADLRQETTALTERWAALDRELAELDRQGDIAGRVDWLQHQVAELQREALDADAIEQLQQTHRRHANASGLLSAYETVLSRLTNDEGLSLQRGLRQAIAELTRQRELEPSLDTVLELLESAGIQLAEAAQALERLRDGLDLDGRELDRLERRLARLHDLGRRHRLPLPQLAARRDELLAELELLSHSDQRRAQLQGERDAAAAAWQTAAARLSGARRQAGSRLATEVSALMSELGMAGGVFACELQAKASDRPLAAGAERCEFLVSANPGQPPRALRKIASGGELARISLAIEVAALGLDSVPTMVFDEVDSGIGGAVAEVVGRKLRALGGSRQVLCVTHLPQVAAQGHQHFQVSKSVNGNATHSVVTALDAAARVEELARMLGGLDIGQETRANARQMLAKAQATPP
jgi:DNA repair protein RecN (Recombination protein N)